MQIGQDGRGVGGEWSEAGTWPQKGVGNINVTRDEVEGMEYVLHD